MQGNITHDEPTTLVVDIFLQGRLTQRLGKMGVRDLRTDLIVHHGVADVLGQAAKFIHVCGAVEEPCDLASLFQWDEDLEDIVEFPSKLCTSGWGIHLGEGGLPFEDFPSRFLLDLTLGDR